MELRRPWRRLRRLVRRSVGERVGQRLSYRLSNCRMHRITNLTEPRRDGSGEPPPQWESLKRGTLPPGQATEAVVGFSNPVGCTRCADRARGERQTRDETILPIAPMSAGPVRLDTPLGPETGSRFECGQLPRPLAPRPHHVFRVRCWERGKQLAKRAPRLAAPEKSHLVRRLMGRFGERRKRVIRRGDEKEANATLRSAVVCCVQQCHRTYIAHLLQLSLDQLQRLSWLSGRPDCCNEASNVLQKDEGRPELSDQTDEVLDELPSRVREASLQPRRRPRLAGWASGHECWAPVARAAIRTQVSCGYFRDIRFDDPRVCKKRLAASTGDP
jgi:hypothetical protein